MSVVEQQVVAAGVDIAAGVVVAIDLDTAGISAEDIVGIAVADIAGTAAVDIGIADC